MAHSILVTTQSGIVYHVRNVSHGPKDNVSVFCYLAMLRTLAANHNHDDGDVHRNIGYLVNHVRHIFHLYLMNHVRHIFHLYFMNHAKNILHLKGIFHLNFRYLQDWDFHLRMQYRLHRLQYRLHHHRTHHQRQYHHMKANHSPEPTTSSV